MLYYDRTDVSEGMKLTRKQIKRVGYLLLLLFFWIKSLNFNQMSAMDAVIY